MMDRNQSRRVFFRRCGQGVAAAGLTAVSTVLGARTLSAMREGRCINQGVCGACRAFGGCGLPAAVEIRKQVKPGDSDHG